MLATAYCLSGAAVAQGGDGTRVWRIGNAGIEQILQLRSGKFSCTSIRNVRADREWIHPSVPSLEFRIDGEMDGKTFQLTGEGPWTVLREGNSTAGAWRQLTIELKSGDLPFHVVRDYLVHERLPILRTRTSVINGSQRSAILHRVDTFHLRVAPSAEPLDLKWLNDFGRAMLPEPGNPLHLCSITENVRQVLRTGPYSPDFGWFSLAMPDTTETLIGGWEWSGPMVVAFGDLQEPCPIEGGLDPDGMREPFAPGARFQAPVGWYGFSGTLEEQAALSHELVRTSLGPPLPAHDFPWVGYCTWACSLDEKSPYNEPGTHPWFPTESNLLSQVDAAAQVGCDLYLWDYGWFPRVGDWWCDPKRFPDGPRTVSRSVKQRGMKLGLWFGFGNADGQSRVAREHPDWLATWNGSPLPDKFFTRTGASVWKTRVLCLGHRPAREWVKQQLSRVIDAFELDWLKHDFDLVTMCDSTSHTHTPGDSRIASCEGFYEIMDFVRQRYPNLVCENWANNSGLPDYGALQRHHVQLIGDTYAAFTLRQMFYGHLFVFPADRQHRYVRFEDSSGDLKTMLRSGLMGGPCTILSDPRQLKPEQRQVLAAEVDRYKHWRGLFATAEVHSILGRPHPRTWDATQFQDSASGRGIVFAFRNGTPEAARPLRLRGLDPDADYRVEMVEANESRVIRGSQMLSAGLTVPIPQANQSEIVLLTRTGRSA